MRGLGRTLIAAGVAATFGLSLGRAESSPSEKVRTRWLGAVGGKSAWRAVKAMSVTGQIRVGEGSAALVPMKMLWSADGRYRMEIERADIGLMLEAYDGKIGWRNNEKLGSGYLAPTELAEAANWNDLAMPTRAATLFTGSQMLPDAFVERTYCNIIDLLRPNGLSERWSIDADTGELRARYRRATANQPQVFTVYDDYRSVRRLRLPFRITTVLAEGKIVTQRETVVLNPSINRTDFVPPEEVRLRMAAVDTILRRNLASLGGLKAVEAIYSRITKQRVDDEVSGLSYEQTTWQRSPHYILTESITPGVGRVVRGFDGVTAWEYSDIQGYHELKGGERAALVGAASLQAQAQLRVRLPLGRIVGMETIEGRPCVGVALSSLSGSAGKYWFDEETGHLRKLMGNLAWGEHGGVEAVLEFSDFRTVDGVTLAFVSRTVHPAIRSRTTLLSVQHNAPLELKMFLPRREG